MSFQSFVNQYLSSEDADRLVKSLQTPSTQLWIGSGNNGKTTLAKVIKNILGEQVVEDEMPKVDIRKERLHLFSKGIACHTMALSFIFWVIRQPKNSITLLSSKINFLTQHLFRPFLH